MKKILVAAALVLASTVALANPYYGHGHRHYPRHSHYDWVVPAIIGGAVVYGVIHARPVPPPPVVVQVPQAPMGYHYESILDANCNCYKTVLVPN
jgi:hypothetical protein|tara:strand:+ start:574 stop:858 length:285 start_codon:yes stop_codon:yes gene_type:complete